jgi:hypothetical protein
MSFLADLRRQMKYPVDFPGLLVRLGRVKPGLQRRALQESCDHIGRAMTCIRIAFRMRTEKPPVFQQRRKLESFPKPPSNLLVTSLLQPNPVDGDLRIPPPGRAFLGRPIIPSRQILQFGHAELAILAVSQGFLWPVFGAFDQIRLDIMVVKSLIRRRFLTSH